MGQDRGGFYSYTWLENLVGCHMHNADEVVPEWQELKVSDSVGLHPKAPPTKVAAIEPGRAIVLKGWGAFVLKSIDEKTTRLIIRSQSFAQELGKWMKAELRRSSLISAQGLYPG